MATREERPDGAMRRVAVRFVGTVQGVGFRWTCCHIAGELGMTGWVRNEWDGSVSLELQGPTGGIGEFFGRLQASYRRYHLDYRIDRMDDVAIVPDEQGFSVRH